MTITGTIESIEYRNTVGHEKKVVTIIPDEKQQFFNLQQRLFVEFRGKSIALLNKIEENDIVTIAFDFDGKTSERTGIQFNNLNAYALSRKK